MRVRVNGSRNSFATVVAAIILFPMLVGIALLFNMGFAWVILWAMNVFWPAVPDPGWLTCFAGGVLIMAVASMWRRG